MANLLQQSLLLLIMNFVAGLLYAATLMRLRAYNYFRLALPISLLLMALITLSLFFTLPTIVVLSLVGFNTVLPYYLSCYNFYVLTSATDEKYYGFVHGIATYASVYQDHETQSCRFGDNILGFVPSILLLMEINTQVILFSVIALCAVACVQSFLTVRKCNNLRSGTFEHIEPKDDAEMALLSANDETEEWE